MELANKLTIARVIGIVMMLIGAVLFVDEIWMFMDIGYNGWLLGDWSVLHVDPFHHWMWGILSFFGGLGLLVAEWWMRRVYRIAYV